MTNDEVTLREAAKLAGITPQPYARDDEHPETWRSNQPGALAGASLDAMLGASRHNRVVRKSCS